MAKSIEDIQGIGPSYGETLRKAGIRSPQDLLQAGLNRQGREELAQKTGLAENLILRWVNMADLFRVKGVAGQYAELLEAAGVDTVKELQTRSPENLAAKMAEINAEKKLCRQTPALSAVHDWIAAAKELPPGVEY
jgi:predicted flap endonuclease-1-like 5' DNA nuclease